MAYGNYNSAEEPHLVELTYGIFFLATHGQAHNQGPNYSTHICPIAVGLHHTLAGWWYTYTSEKYDFVSWDDDIPN